MVEELRDVDPRSEVERSGPIGWALALVGKRVFHREHGIVFHAVKLQDVHDPERGGSYLRTQIVSAEGDTFTACWSDHKGQPVSQEALFIVATGSIVEYARTMNEVVSYVAKESARVGAALGIEPDIAVTILRSALARQAAALGGG